ncbi:MAG TPA: hypothetical protein VMV27_09055 [Candidatus Binataceae bacterium]|nr:hypothetical protein [Candidatus Binataceae bacterium]
MNRKAVSAKRSNPHGPRPRLTLDISPSLKRRIKIAAASHEMPVSAYVTRLLDRAVPPGRALNRAADGSISSGALRRFAGLRAEQRAPFLED